MHICFIHSLNKAIWKEIENILKGNDNDPLIYLITEGLKILSSFLTKDKIPINAQSLKNDEYQADEWAIKYVTKDLKNAISCLEKLVDYDLTKSSHKWEFFNTRIPIMSMNQRIIELKRRCKNVKI